MSAITDSGRFVQSRTPASSAPLHDVIVRIKAWGRLGVIFGAGFGLVFGALFVAIPYTSNVLTFGAIGTLLVGMVECAFIAGAFAALAASLGGKGVHGGNAAECEHILQDGRHSAAAFSRDVPLADWPDRCAYSDPADRLSLPENPDSDLSTTYSLLEAQNHLGTIDAWENGNTGP